MYELPHNIDLNFFIGRTLESLGLGKITINLFFDEKVELSINGAFTFNNKYFESQENSKTGYVLHVLIDKKIISAKHGAGEGDLVLEFDNGHKLILHDDSEQSEAYNFWGPDGLVVV